MKKTFLYQVILIVFVITSLSMIYASEESKERAEPKAVLMSPTDEPAMWNRVKGITEKATDTELEAPDKEFEEIIVNALKTTNQKGYFYVYLRNDRSSGSSIRVKIHGLDHKIIIFKNPKSFAEYKRLGIKVIKSVLYHELGHHFHNHIAETYDADKCGDSPAKFGWQGESSPGLFDHQIHEMYDRSKVDEWIADNFMIHHLLMQKDILSLIHEFFLHIAYHKAKIHGPHYPSNLDRAALILTKLQEGGYDLFKLPIDKDIQENFTEHIGMYFPKILAKVNPELFAIRAGKRARKKLISLFIGAAVGLAGIALVNSKSK